MACMQLMGITVVDSSMILKRKNLKQRKSLRLRMLLKGVLMGSLFGGGGDDGSAEMEEQAAINRREAQEKVEALDKEEMGFLRARTGTAYIPPGEQ